jgi:ribosomal protein S18 acetylase RimI-like enzyme
MTYAIQGLVIRHVSPFDTAEITGLVAAAMGGGPVARWVHQPHHYLAFLAVHPDAQNRGIGSALLDRHHARLDRAGLPAYLEANDPRNRDLYLRHGYRVRSVIDLPDGPPLRSMWRTPMP